MFRDMNEAYLEAAVEAGALTFDLAANLDPLVNGPNGGRYMYDPFHYTIEGSAEVARLLRSKLMEILSED